MILDLNMSQLAPVIAVTAAAVGWIMLAFERQSSNRLRKRLEIVEAHCLDFDSKAKHRHLESRDNAGIAICRGKLNPGPRWQEDVEIENEETLQQKRLMQQIQELCKEFEDEDPNTMLQAEDQALKDLHKELVELRSSIERDIGVKNSNPTIIKTNGDFSEGTSGTTTPAVHTPPGSIVPAFSSSSSIRSGHLELTTPSPSQGGPSIFRAYSSGTPSSAPESIGNLSGKSTPPSPQSPYGSFNFSVSFCSGNHLDNGTFTYSGKPRKPYCSDTMPPLPPRDVAPPPMIDKALQASLSMGSGKDLLDEIGDSSEDDEEWLVKPMDQASGNAISKPTVKPLPKVPKLALSAINNTGAPNGNRTSRDRMRSARGPLTLSVRDGIPCRFEANKAPSTSRKSKLPSTPRSPPELMTARYRPKKISTPRLMKPLNLDKRNLADSFKCFESPRICSPGLSGMSSGTGSSDSMPASARLSRIPKPHVNDC